MLDVQSQDYALHSAALIILFYNASIHLLMWLAKRPRFAFKTRPELAGKHHRPRSSHLWQVGSAVSDRSRAGSLDFEVGFLAALPYPPSIFSRPGMFNPPVSLDSSERIRACALATAALTAAAINSSTMVWSA